MCISVTERVWLWIEMEMTCELVEDDYCWQESNAVEDTPVPETVNLTSISHSDGSIEHKIILSNTSSAAKRPSSPLPSELPTKNRKRNADCSVVVEKLPTSLVQAAETSMILVCDSSNAGATILKSGDVASTAPNQPHRDLSVNTELDEPGDVKNDEQSLTPHFTTHQSSVASTAVGTSPACTGVRSDISVILLSSAQPPKVAASDATDSAAATQPQDVSRLVLSMLEQQNISLLSLGNNNSVTRDENEQRGPTSAGSSRAADDAATLRKLLRVYERHNAVLETKLKEERAKVSILLAEIASLKNTGKGSSVKDVCSEGRGTNKTNAEKSGQGRGRL